jgi:hypothetical protein
VALRKHSCRRGFPRSCRPKAGWLERTRG